MPIQHRSQIETAISRLNQTAYGTARANSDVFRRIISDSQEVADIDTQFQDDAGYDHGTDMANDVWAVTNGTGLSLTPDFCFQDIGYLLKDALGGYAVTGTGPYTHTFTPQNVNTSRQLPQRTILKKYGSLKLILFRDMVCKSLAFNFGKTGRIKTAAQYGGSGYHEENPVGYSSPAIVDDREWAYNGQYSGFKFTAPGPVVQEYKCAIEVGTLTISNPEADDGYRQCSDYLVPGDPKSGTVKKEDLLGVRDYTFDFTARLDTGDPLRGWLKAGTFVEWETVITGVAPDNHSLALSHDRVRIIEAKEVPDAGGFIGISGRCRFMANSGVIGFSAELINDVASYAV